MENIEIVITAPNGNDVPLAMTPEMSFEEVLRQVALSAFTLGAIGTEHQGQHPEVTVKLPEGAKPKL